MRIVYLDTETTGLDPKRNGLVQIAAQVVERGKVLDEIDLKIAPFPRDEIDQKALDVNGLTVDEIAGFREPHICCDEFAAFFGAYCPGNARLFLSGYNIGFDDQFIRTWFAKCGKQPNDFARFFYTPAIDVMSLAAFALMSKRQSMPNFKQSTVAKILGVEIQGEAHDASVDIKTTRGILRAIYPALGAERG